MKIKRFSKDSSKKSNKTQNSLIAGAGTIGGALLLNNNLNKNIDKEYKKGAKNKESNKIYNRFRKDFRRKGGNLMEGKDLYGNIIRDDGFRRSKDVNLKIIHITGKTKGNASVLGHELGHAHYLTNPKADKIGRYAHKLYPISDNSTLIGLGAGIASGIRSAKKEENGEKEGIINRSSGIIASISANLPRLVAEGKASQYGHKLMKNMKASKELLKFSKRNNRKALLTYGLGGVVADIGASEIGRAVGRAYYNNIIKGDHKDEDIKTEK